MSDPVDRGDPNPEQPQAFDPDDEDGTLLDLDWSLDADAGDDDEDLIT